MTTWRQLRDLDLGPLGTAREEWGSMSNRLSSYSTRLDSEVRQPLQHAWKGEGSDAAHNRFGRVGENFQYGSQECGFIRSTLDGLVEELRQQQKQLKDWLDFADSHGYKVNDNGEVNYANPDEVPVYIPESPPKEELWRQDLEEEIASVVKKAEEIDTRYTSLLQKLHAKRGLKVDWSDARRDVNAVNKTASSGLSLDSIPPKSTDPAAVNDWWKGLSKEEQEEYLVLHPAEIGNLEGIPATVRDRANRNYLPRLIDKYESDPDLSEDEKQKLDGFKKIRNRLEDNALGVDDTKQVKVPPALLLGIGDEGQGRAILSYGNPDTADNVSAYVPGLNTKLSNVGGGDGTRAENIWKSAYDTDPNHSTASIVWLGYDAPQTGTDAGVGNFAVAGEERGKQGGADFDHFLNGIRATHEGARPHVTAVGHSYGSFTVGQAAQRPDGIPADDIILVGSPGTGAQKADQLGVGADHVWVGSAKNDPVTHLPSKEETGGTAIEGIVGGPFGGLLGGGIAHAADPHELWFGQDPASAEFGGQRFDVADGQVSDAHSNYMKPGRGESGESLSNIGKIVTGNGDTISRQEPR